MNRKELIDQCNAAFRQAYHMGSHSYLAINGLPKAQLEIVLANMHRATALRAMMDSLEDLAAAGHPALLAQLGGRRSAVIGYIPSDEPLRREYESVWRLHHNVWAQPWRTEHLHLDWPRT